jgi:hypothetical protein
MSYRIAARVRSTKRAPIVEFDRTRLLSIAGVLDQIVQLAREHDENPDERSGT